MTLNRHHLALALGAALLGGVAAAQSPAPVADPPADPDLAAIQANCTACHEIGQVLSVRKTAPEWSETIVKMKGIGAQVEDPDQEKILRYLNSHNAPAQ